MPIRFCLAYILAAAGCNGAPRGTVRVTVFNRGEPGVGLTAVFLAPWGVEVARGVTDESGQVSAEVHSGDAVTVVGRSDSGNTLLSTVSGLEPGDDILLGDPTVRNEPAGSMTVSFPPHDGPAGSFSIYTPCVTSFTQSTTAEAVFCSHCVTERVDFLVETENSVEFVQLLDVPLVDGDSVTVPGDAASWQPARQVDVALDGPDADEVGVDLVVESGNGTTYQGYSSSGTAERKTFEMPPDFGQRTRATLIKQVNHSIYFQTTRQERVHQSVPDQLDIDVASPSFLPLIERPRVDGGTLEVHVEGGGDWDLTQFTVYLSSSGSPVTWQIAAPGGTTRIEPAALLPAELADLFPTRYTRATATIFAVDGDGSDLRRMPQAPKRAIESARPGASYVLRYSYTGDLN